MLKALRTPMNAGGVTRNKAERSARISARITSICVLSAIGSPLLFIGISCTALAQEAAVAAPNPGKMVAPPTTRPPATSAAAQASTLQSDTKDWPPTLQLLSPSHPLNPKSKRSVNLVEKWRARNVMPTMGDRGAVRFIYGATEDTVVCAPLRLCDIELQPGEIVQNVNLGDPVMWSCPPAVSGSGSAEITHLMCKPSDAGLETSLAIQTSRRSYSINLVSTRTSYMPRVSWAYPEDQASQWAAYQLHSGTQHQQIPAEGYIRYELSGDNPPWKPVVAYSDGHSTYISFPPSMAYGKAPVLERLP